MKSEFVRAAVAAAFVFLGGFLDRLCHGDLWGLGYLDESMRM